MSPSSCCCSCSSQFSPEVPEHTEICGPGSQANNFEFEIIPDNQNKVEIIAVLKTIFTSSTINFKPSMCSHCANSLQRLYLVYTEFNGLLNEESTLGKVLKKVEVGAVIKEEYEVIEEIKDAIFDNGGESDGEETDPLLVVTEDDNEGQNPPLNFCNDYKLYFLSDDDEEFKKHRAKVHYRPNQRTSAIKIISSKKGKPMVSVAGHLFQFHSNGVEKKIWVCAKRVPEKCPVRIHTSDCPLNPTLICQMGVHTDQPNLMACDVKEVMSELRKKAIVCSDNPGQIIDDITVNLPPSSRAHLPLKRNMKRSIQTARQVNGGSLPIPHSRETINLPPAFTTTKSGESFIFFDPRKTVS